MYIPIWVIIVVGLVWLYYEHKKEKARENLPLTPDEEEAQASLRKLSKQWKHDSDVNAHPDLDKFNDILKLHQSRVDKIKDEPNSVKIERERLDNQLLFSQRLWRFVDDVKYYPSWLENSKKQGKPPYWKSVAIQPSELVMKKFSASKLSDLVEPTIKFNENDDIIEYSFDTDDKNYTLFINRETSRQDTNYFDSSEKWEPIYYYPVFIFENGDRLVYQAKLFYESGEYADSYDRFYLEAFKPSQWTKYLLGKMSAVRAEEEKSSKEFRAKMNKDIEIRNKEKFID